MTTRPDIANPVTISPKTPTAYFALCVPVRSANKGFNNGASCKVKISVGYAYEAAECAKVVPRAKSFMKGEFQGMPQNRNRCCIEGLAAEGCLDPGRRSVRISLG